MLQGFSGDIPEHEYIGVVMLQRQRIHCIPESWLPPFTLSGVLCHDQIRVEPNKPFCKGSASASFLQHPGVFNEQGRTWQEEEGTYC